MPKFVESGKWRFVQQSSLISWTEICPPQKKEQKTNKHLVFSWQASAVAVDQEILDICRETNRTVVRTVVRGVDSECAKTISG